MTLRDQAKNVVRMLAKTDHNAGVWRDGLRVGFDVFSDDQKDAITLLGVDAYKVWLAAYREIEREALLRRWPTAACLIEFWERPWSTSALRFAAHQLAKARAKGLSVLEHEPLA